MEKTHRSRSIQEKGILRIVLIGPESSGKTTLAKILATHFNTYWIPEYCREYAQNKWDIAKESLDKNDVIPIAKGQIALENKYLSKNTTQKLVFFDTDILSTKVYANAYYHQDYPELDRLISENKESFYLLCNVDIPWEPDDLRDKPNERNEMFFAFKKALKDHQKEYITIHGNLTERTQLAINKINSLLKDTNII